MLPRGPISNTMMRGPCGFNSSRLTDVVDLADRETCRQQLHQSLLDFGDKFGIAADRRNRIVDESRKIGLREGQSRDTARIDVKRPLLVQRPCFGLVDE